MTMTTAPQSPAVVDRRVSRLLRWYPRSWRARYGAEFAELLAADIAEQPRSLRRSVDVARSGLRNRLALLALTGHPFDPHAAAKAGLTTPIWCAASCGILGASMWSQLAIGAQWAVPRHQGFSLAIELMNTAMLAFGLLAALLLAGISRHVVGAIRAGQARTVLLPTSLLIVGAAVLIIGGRHFANAWPGTGGHLLTPQDLVPTWLAAFCWATTMWITSYLAHPAALAAFPAAQLAWMAICPAAICVLLIGASRLVRQVRRSPGALRFELWLSGICAAGMLLFAGGGLCWLLSPTGLMPAFHAGSIDKVAVLAVVLLLGAGAQALRHGRLAATTGPDRL